MVDAPFPPGSTIGILGGGQLGRMTAMAAAEMGYRTVTLDPQPDSPAGQVATERLVGEFTDRALLERIAATADVITIEFENIPLAALDFLSEHLPVRPGRSVVETSQDRLREKSFFRDNRLPTCRFARIDGPEDLRSALGELDGKGILKTRRFGYDGKGQARLDKPDEAGSALAEIGNAPAILEEIVAFEREISVVVARGVDGQSAAYIPVENVHRNHILHTTTAPAPIDPDLAEEAVAIATRTAEALEVVGLLAVEMFVRNGSEILINEIAPRPHNSGHWTIDACLVSQFEQLVRAVTGLPLAQPGRHSDAVMTNLIDADANEWEDLFARPDTRVHIYGKAKARPGRKMGHVTRLLPRSD